MSKLASCHSGARGTKRAESKYSQKLKSRRASCQVKECINEVPSKAYHQRYKICAEHASAPHLVLDGCHMRFCQHHGRFHPIAEFDRSFRSCRASLERHRNTQARRLKKQLANVRHGSSSDDGEGYGGSGGSGSGGAGGTARRPRTHGGGSSGDGTSSRVTLTTGDGGRCEWVPPAQGTELPALSPSPLPLAGPSGSGAGEEQLQGMLSGAAPSLGPALPSAVDGIDINDLLNLEITLDDHDGHILRDWMMTELDAPAGEAAAAGPRTAPALHLPPVPALPAARAEPLHVPSLDAQRRYRQRKKEQAAATEAALATASAAVATLRAEQVVLREEHRALELLRHYSESFITTLRYAADTLASALYSAASTVLSLQTDIMDFLWSKALHLSDAKLRLFARHADRLRPGLANVFVGRLVAAVEQWHRSPPAGREAVEIKLRGIFESRARLITIILTEFPETREVNVMCARDGDATALHAIIDGAASLSSSDVLNTVVLTADQISALNSHWDIYTARYRGAKGLLAAAAAQVHLASETFATETASLRGVMRRNADAQRGAAAASAFQAEERAARADLLASSSRTLSPIQCAWLQLMAVRVLAVPDIVGAVKHVLPHMVRAPVPTPAALLAMVGVEAGVGEEGK